MKKTLFAALALVSMASCSNEEVLEVAQKEAIGFENAFVNNSTRSVSDPSTSTNTIADFAVYGFVKGDATATTSATLFNGVTVNKKIENDELDATNPWNYKATQYWIKDAVYNFAAVSPVEEQKWSVKTGTTPSPTGMELSFENTGTQDLLYAQLASPMTGLATNNPAVAFTFNHILSKVKFSFYNAYNATAATIRVKEIKITNAYKTGNVALTASSTNWSNRSTDLVLDFGMATDNEATTDAKENEEVAYAYKATYESQKELLLIPNTDTTEGAKDKYNVTFTVDLLVSGTLIKTYNHTATVEFKPEPGKSYDIKAEINAGNIDPEKEQEAIEFTVTAINGWDNPNGSTTDINSTVNTSGN